MPGVLVPAAARKAWLCARNNRASLHNALKCYWTKPVHLGNHEGAIRELISVAI